MSRSFGAELFALMDADIASGSFVPDLTGLEPGEHMTQCPCGDCIVRRHVPVAHLDGLCARCEDCSSAQNHSGECGCSCRRFAPLRASQGGQT